MKSRAFTLSVSSEETGGNEIYQSEAGYFGRSADALDHAYDLLAGMKIDVVDEETGEVVRTVDDVRAFLNDRNDAEEEV